MSRIILDHTKCTGCNACVRACPTKDANIATVRNKKFVIDIDDKRCIKCGACIRACTHGARDYEDDTEAFFKAVEKGENIGLIVAPAVHTAYGSDWAAYLKTLRSSGVSRIYDVSLGADICTWAHIKYLKESKGAKVISQPCAAIVNYALRYNNALLRNLSPIHSPMLCLASYIRNYTPFTGKLAALSPCVAKGDEFEQTGLVQYNVTFKRVREYFEKHNIPLEKGEFRFDLQDGYEGTIYPRPGGLKDAIQMHYHGADILNSEGTDHVYDDLDDYTNTHSNQLPDVFDVLSCRLGCNMGIGVGNSHVSYFQINHIMHGIEETKTRSKSGQALAESEKRFAEFDKTLSLEKFARNYDTESDKDDYTFTPSEVEKAFKAMWKNTEASRKFNCHACGYHTCSDMAHAIAKGKNIPENCMQYQIAYANKERRLRGDINNYLLQTSLEINDHFDILQQNLNDINQQVKSTEKQNRSNDLQLSDLGRSLSGLVRISEKINGATQHISESVENYAIMTNKVSQIATQINILSINANIEAVRAGALGKGFAVVASEVGNLARSSQETVGDADSINKAISDDMAKISEIAGTIISSVEAIIEDIQTISAGIAKTVENGGLMKSEMDKVNELSESVGKMLKATAENLTK